MAGLGKTGGGSLFTVVSATTLVATQAIATAIAAGWALAGLMHLGDIGEYALMALFSLAALYISVKYFRRAHAVEMSLN
ncbi:MULTISPECIES: hypothetical protein [Xanthobacter]|uniref:hypothetical protein n=1 Tax=Xanthobacter TaxID=279 RepID=UPI002022E563|nr:hypothetical protein [Xanthobacter aminoxidans]MCL8381343.1 hypothetical protein [Xanthobacter aminoxidans]